MRRAYDVRTPFLCSDHDRNSRGNRPSHKHSILFDALHCTWSGSGNSEGNGNDYSSSGSNNDDPAAGKWPNKITFIIRSFNITKTTIRLIFVLRLLFVIICCSGLRLLCTQTHACSHARTHSIPFPLFSHRSERQIPKMLCTNFWSSTFVRKLSMRVCECRCLHVYVKRRTVVCTFYVVACSLRRSLSSPAFPFTNVCLLVRRGYGVGVKRRTDKPFGGMHASYETFMQTVQN